jgi:geranylgeranyl pyrophosphate synthase
VPTGGAAADAVSLFATAVRIIDDILDEHTVRLYSEEGVATETWWVRRGIYLAVVDSVALMVKAKRAARGLGVERELVDAAARMVGAVRVELELERTGRPPTLSDWLKAAEREAAFREFAYGLAGLDQEAGYVEGLAAQIRDDLLGATKGGREDTETRLNRPLIQRVCTRPEEALDALKTAKRREEAAEILAATC